MDKIPVALYGCGKMAALLANCLAEKGGEVVAAFDLDAKKIGGDIGDVLGGGKKGVAVDGVELGAERLREKKPLVCFIATGSRLADMEGPLRLCASLGVNAISLAEEAFYPWNSASALAAELDRLAKKNRCTLTASGYQDVFWCNLITTVAGATAQIRRIEGRSVYDVAGFGKAMARRHGIGLNPDAFAEEFSSAETEGMDGEIPVYPGFMWHVNGWLAAEWKLHIRQQSQICAPVLADDALEPRSLGLSIPKGHVRGLKTRVTTETSEGIRLETESCGLIFQAGEIAVNDWKICGAPETRLTVENPDAAALTAATAVNRIPDVVNAAPGFLTTNWLPVNRFRPHPLASYIKGGTWEGGAGGVTTLKPPLESGSMVCGLDGVCRPHPPESR